MTLADWIASLPETPDEAFWVHTLRDEPPFSCDFPEQTAALLTRLEGRLGSQTRAFRAVLLRAGHVETAIRQLIDFLETYDEQQGKPFDLNHPEVAALLVIFGNSEFLARRLTRTPQWATHLLNSLYLRQEKSLEVMQQEIAAALPEPLTLEGLKTSLRNYKYQEYLRITARDLGKLGAFSETLRELSSVAVATLQAAFLGVLRIEGLPPSTYPFTVLGMGKLGGNELNYSSDIDLIFIHNDSPITGDADKDEALRPRIARRLMEVMRETTADGFLARVDMRLRPGGDAGPLVQSVDSVENYYAARGELWERQMLIKARCVAGDAVLGVQFSKMMAPFVFSKLLDERLLREVEHVKQRIEQEHLREHHLNVKLGVGGIREIEFFVQTFQLLYGGGRPELRVQGTLEVLDVLQELKLIPQADLKILRDAYLYLRRLEHALQLREEHQTHTIPTEPAPQRIIARVMGFDDLDPEQARQRLLNHTRDVMARVRAIFGGLFSQRHVEIEAAIRSSARIRHLQEEEAQLIESLSRQLVPLFEARQDLLSERSTRITERSLLETRFQQLFDRIGAKLHHYRLLLGHPSGLSRMARIAETSEMLWNYLINHLDLLEQLEAPLELSQANWSVQLQEGLQALEDEEEKIDFLRQFKHMHTFLIGSAELEGLLPYEEARRGLTALAEVITQQALQLSIDLLQPRFGVLEAVEEAQAVHFGIIGMGKLGGRELTYHSDLDLIFIYDGSGRTTGKLEVGAQEYWVKVIQRLISVLGTMTRTGYAYKLDARLRPSGNAGVLVTPLQAYVRYHETSQPWEHQALIKGRLVGGIGGLEWEARIQEYLEQAVYEWEFPEGLREQITHLRQRKEHELAGETSSRRNLKEGRGGLLDVEFLVQYLQLLHGRAHPELRTPHTLEALQQLGHLGILAAEEAHTLSRSYRLLRVIENVLRLLYDESTNTVDLEKLPEELLHPMLQRQGHESAHLPELILETTETIRASYERIMTS
jgi:glutamate-ammonia-ligase adenylyltransferase